MAVGSDWLKGNILVGHFWCSSNVPEALHHSNVMNCCQIEGYRDTQDEWPLMHVNNDHQNPYCIGLFETKRTNVLSMFLLAGGNRTRLFIVFLGWGGV